MVDLATALAQIAQKAKLASEAATSFRGELYGPSGVGKSVIAAMIMRNLVQDGLIIDIDTSEGYVSWQNHPGLSDGIVVIPFTSIDDLSTLADGIKNKVPPFENVKGIIFDEGSKMAEQDAIRVNRSRQAGTFGENLQKTANVVVDGPDYMIALERWREMLFKMMDIRDLNIIVCAHQAEKKDRSGGVIGVFPQFSPKINASTKEYMHLVANLTRTVQTNLERPGEPDYVMKAQVHPTIMVDAKCRMNIRTISVYSNELPGLIYNWLYAGGKLEKAEDKAAVDEPNIETLTSGTTGEVNPNATLVDENYDLSTTDFGLETVN